MSELGEFGAVLLGIYPLVELAVHDGVELECLIRLGGDKLLPSVVKVEGENASCLVVVFTLPMLVSC